MDGLMSTAKRKLITLEVLPLLLTAIIAISACASTYFAYQTAIIASGQESREERKELIQWMSLLKDLAESVSKLQKQEEPESTHSDNKTSERNAEKDAGS